ncbi:unnamed protein product, partial [marine sediment metagenome]
MNMKRKIFPAGNYIDYWYDPNGNLLKISKEPNDGDPNIVTSYTYEPHFNFVKTVADPMGNVTTLDYNDTNGDLNSITYPEVNTPSGKQQPVVNFSYDSNGQVETITAPDGIVTKLEYGADEVNEPNNYGRLVKVIMDYNETASNALNITSEYEYDALGRVSEVNDPNGYKTKLAYNALDLLTKITDPCTNVTNFSYNKVKKISQIEREITSEPNQIIKYAYDILDNLKRVTDPC